MFGSTLISHVSLKVRERLGLNGIMLVDCPGMIDSPSSCVAGRLAGALAGCVVAPDRAPGDADTRSAR